MADVILLEDRNTAAALNSSGDTYFLDEGVTHQSTEASSLLRLHGWADQTFYSVIVNGTMASLGDGNAIESLEYDVTRVSIVVSDTGRIQATENWRGISMQSTYVTVSNNGEIAAAETVRLSGEHGVLNNTGTLTGTYAGPSTVFAVILGGANAKLNNTGLIVGANGLRLSEDAVISNSGTIIASDIAVSSSTTDTGDTIWLHNSGMIDGGDYAFVSGFSADTLVNTGTMQGRVTTGVADDRVINKGTLAGDVRLENGNDTLINTGMIAGDVMLGLNDDTYRGRADGVVAGRILGESGNDDLRGSPRDDVINGGWHDDTLRGGSGDDTLEGDTGLDRILGGGGDDEISGGDDADKLYGNAGDDTLDGGAGSDVLRGGAGEDVLSGGWDDDTLRAGAGDDDLDGGAGVDRLLGHRGEDTIDGGVGDDRLSGNGGDDVLQGGAGADHLRAGGGDDTLEGGAGADTLFGGAGADSFVYTSATDSAFGAADVISGFETGQDVLDVEALIEDAFLYVGEAAHSGSGTGSIRDINSSLGRSVFVDIDGDGFSDMEIVLKGVTALTADDFIL